MQLTTKQRLAEVQSQLDEVARLMKEAQVLLNQREKIISQLFTIYVKSANEDAEVKTYNKIMMSWKKALKGVK